MRRPEGQEFAVLRNGIQPRCQCNSPWQGICAESLAAIGRIHALRGGAHCVLDCFTHPTYPR